MRQDDSFGIRVNYNTLDLKCALDGRQEQNL